MRALPRSGTVVINRAGAVMEFGLLGPLEVRQRGCAVPVAGHRTRALLGAMLLHPNEVVPTYQLIDALWGEAPPPGALHALHAHASKLRAALRTGGDGVLVVTAPGGYQLPLDGHELDMLRFEQLVAEGRRRLAAHDAEDAVTTMRSAEALWRGPPLAEFAGEAFVEPAVTRLEELHWSAIEMRLEAELTVG